MDDCCVVCDAELDEEQIIYCSQLCQWIDDLRPAKAA